jgi:hypothetical protein
MYFWLMHLLSSYSLWWILPIVALSAVLSHLFYRNETWIKSKSKYLKYTLLALRTSSLSLIGILLLGLLLEQTHFETEKPVILTLVDRSSSMNNYKESAALEKQIAAYQNAINEKLGEPDKTFKDTSWIKKIK